jgi:hypothetical protein
LFKLKAQTQNEEDVMTHQQIVKTVIAVAIGFSMTAGAFAGTQQGGTAKGKKGTQTVVASKHKGEKSTKSQSKQVVPAVPTSTQATSDEKAFKNSQVQSSRPVRLIDNQKSPALAFGLSFVLPGAGQFYNGDYLKGAIQTTLFAAGLTLALALGEEESVYSSGAYTDYSYYGTYTYYNPSYSGGGASAWLYVGIGLAAGSWLWSVIDAPLSASAINEAQDDVRFGHMFEMKSGSNVVGLDLGLQRQGVAMNVVVHF